MIGAGYSNKTGYPSVTQVFRPWIDARWFTDEARDRGRAVHAAAAAHLQGLYVPPLPPGWAPYFDSFRAWADLMLDDVIMVERRLVDTVRGYCGQADLVCTLRGRAGAVLVDWKTSATPEKWWSLQVAAYRQLCSDGYLSETSGRVTDNNPVGIETAAGASVMLMADGSVAVAAFYGQHMRDFNVFMGALVAHQFFEGRK